MKEDYNSSKWCRGGRTLVAPSFSRTYLSDKLALNFIGNQRERWLEFSTSSTPPSVVPPDPDADTRLPSLEERRGKFVQNRARCELLLSVQSHVSQLANVPLAATSG